MNTVWLAARACVWILMFVCAGCVTAASPQPSSAAADQILRDILEVDGGVGISASAVKGGAVVWSGTAGSSDIESATAMARDTRLRVGSVSKSLTGALALRMAQAGIVDLDASVRRYLTALPLSYEPITLDMLANHTSGVRHFDFANFDEANNTTYHGTLADAVYARADSLVVAAAGSAFMYSSHGYNILGAALEAAGGASFDALINEHLAEPAGLSTISVDHPFSIIDRRAAFYTLTAANPYFEWMADDEIINTIYRDSSDYYPSGGMLASAADLAVFARELFAGSLLTQEMRTRLLTSARLLDGTAVDYSYGWELRRGPDGSIVAYAHNGETNGAYALIRYEPSADLAVAGAVNYNSLRGEPAFFRQIGESLPALFRK